MTGRASRSFRLVAAALRIATGVALAALPAAKAADAALGAVDAGGPVAPAAYEIGRAQVEATVRAPRTQVVVSDGALLGTAGAIARERLEALERELLADPAGEAP
jgi:hypothetical protein